MKNTNQKITRKECWKAIAGSINYEVSNRGKVRNVETGELVKTYLNNSTGYVHVWIRVEQNKLTSRYVHRLVA